MKFFGPHRPERVLLRRNTLYISGRATQCVGVAVNGFRLWWMSAGQVQKMLAIFGVKLDKR